MNSITLSAYKALIETENDEISLLANTSAFLNQMLLEINWVGFYILKHKTLVLGPFQGLVACNKIPLNEGVCGYAARIRKPVSVDDVHQFDGHIACDQNSKSEFVIPLFVKRKLYGVLDMDSPIYARFDDSTKQFLINIARLLQKRLTFILS